MNYTPVIPSFQGSVKVGIRGNMDDVIEVPSWISPLFKYKNRAAFLDWQEPRKANADSIHRQVKAILNRGANAAIMECKYEGGRKSGRMKECLKSHNLKMDLSRRKWIYANI